MAEKLPALEALARELDSAVANLMPSEAIQEEDADAQDQSASIAPWRLPPS